MFMKQKEKQELQLKLEIKSMKQHEQRFGSKQTNLRSPVKNKHETRNVGDTGD